jgi:hypothetical protein
VQISSRPPELIERSGGREIDSTAMLEQNGQRRDSMPTVTGMQLINATTEKPKAFAAHA